MSPNRASRREIAKGLNRANAPGLDKIKKVVAVESSDGLCILCGRVASVLDVFTPFTTNVIGGVGTAMTSSTAFAIPLCIACASNARGEWASIEKNAEVTAVLARHGVVL